jgi:hypothetical protein
MHDAGNLSCHFIGRHSYYFAFKSTTELPLFKYGTQALLTDTGIGPSARQLRLKIR